MTKFFVRWLSSADLATITANLAKLDASQRFNGKSNPQCDFCGGDNPRFQYAANRLTTGQPVRCWRWLACPECHALITANDFDALAERGAKALGGGERAKSVVKAALLPFHADALTSNV